MGHAILREDAPCWLKRASESLPKPSQKRGSYKPATVQALVIEGSKAGHSMRRIARECGVDRSTVKTILSQPEIEEALRQSRDTLLKTLLAISEMVTTDTLKQRDRAESAWSQMRSSLSICATHRHCLRTLPTFLMRPGLDADELHRLNRQDINFAAGRHGTLKVRLGKTEAARRTLPLAAKVRCILAAHHVAADSPAIPEITTGSNSSSSQRIVGEQPMLKLSATTTAAIA